MSHAENLVTVTVQYLSKSCIKPNHFQILNLPIQFTFIIQITMYLIGELMNDCVKSARDRSRRLMAGEGIYSE